ncbi:MAG TPA: transglycosylase SLT domain-containing protein [Bacteroidales bacterium]|nr:transglycosylase SLT domain-containing protein [Bacteroidales bacterium]
MKGRILLTLFTAVFTLPAVMGQENESDTLSMPGTQISSGFEDNLDSLLNLYYIQQAIQFDGADSIYLVEEDTLIPDYPDSVYIDRLSRIPSVIDLSYNRIVKNFIELYTRQRRERVSVMLTLSQYYFPLFEEVFDRYNLPYELRYMPVIESALNPRAVSRAGATGIWQFMYSTGRHYGLTINSLVDERRDPYKSTVAAAEFLQDLYGIYKDWVLVIAAYNCGPGNVNKAIRRSGGKRNYWDIYYYLPRETRGYVPAFIAASYVMNYYDQHNLSPVAVDFELNSDTLMIHDKLHLKQVSEVLGIPIHQLRDLNPQYRHDIIPGDSKTYALRIPKVQEMRFIELEDSIFAYKDSIYFNPDNMIVNPTSRHYSIPELPSGKYTKMYYTVKPGDNLGYISMWYNVRISDLRYWNNIRSNVIRTGQKLVVFVPNGRATKYTNVNTASFAEKQRLAGQPASKPSVAATTVPDNPTGEFTYYTVRSGDTLWEIARKFPGVSDLEIAKTNELKYGATIKPGQVLKIRKKI